MIRKLKSGEYRLYSVKKDAKTGRRRNLGTFKNLDAAKQHVAFSPNEQVQGTPGSISGPIARARTPRASTTAPEVSPPATTNARTSGATTTHRRR